MALERSNSTEHLVEDDSLSVEKQAFYRQKIINNNFHGQYDPLETLISLTKSMYDPYDVEHIEKYHNNVAQIDHKLMELKCLNESIFNFFQNTLLRLYVAHSLDLFQLFQQSLNDHAKELLDKKKIDQEMYDFLTGLAHFIFMNRPLESEKEIWISERNQVLLESTALATTALVVGLAPFMMVNPKIIDPIPVIVKGSVTAAEKAGSIARFHNTLKRGSAESRLTKFQYLKKQIKENPVKIGAGSALFIGAAAASFFIPIVGQVLLIAMAVASAAFIGKRIYDSWKSSQEREKLISQHEKELEMVTMLYQEPSVTPPTASYAPTQQNSPVSAYCNNEEERKVMSPSSTQAPQTLFQPKSAVSSAPLKQAMPNSEPANFRFRF